MSAGGGGVVDLRAYLERIGRSEADLVEAGLAGTGPAESSPAAGPRPSLALLEALHEAHLAHIPFENIDVRLRRPIGLDVASVQAKLVHGRRGGYCFEQNALFAAVLRALGFDLETLEARVRPPGPTATLPRTHMVLEVRVEGGEHLADVGFGGTGPLRPVPLDGTVSQQPGGGTYRVDREDDGLHVLRHRWRGAWHDLYAFTRVPALPVDYEVAHHFTSTWPRSPFVNVLTVQRSHAGERHILRGRTYTIVRGEEETVAEIDDAEVATLLRGVFGLSVSDEEALEALGNES